MYVLTCAGCSTLTSDENALFDRVLAGAELHPELARDMPQAPSLDGSFTSTQHGYTFDYPAAWSMLQRATESAPIDRMPVALNPSLDALGAADQRLSVTSRKLDKSQTPEAWVQAFCAITQTTWSPACDQD